MADTINVPINNARQWVEALAGPATGVASIAGGGQHCIHAGAPATDLIGHRFTGDLVSFNIGVGEALYVKADSKTTVIITED